MKVLFATKNPAKIKRYAEELEKRNIEVATVKDLGIDLHVEENGKNAIENAYIKAKAYYDKTVITTIGIDNNLFIEELPDEKQPGTHVRRVNGKAGSFLTQLFPNCLLLNPLQQFHAYGISLA